MRNLNLVMITLSLLLLSGCITIFEKYTIHADGSGTMEYIIDMSEMYEMMAAFSDSTEEMDMGLLDESMREALPALNGIKGISNVKLTGNPGKFIAGIRFDFEDAEALNKAMAVLLESEVGETGNPVYVEIKGKTFTRFSQTSGELNKEELMGTEEIDEETMKSMLESMKYNISVNFDRPVKKVTSQATNTQEGNTVTIEANFSEIFDNSDFLKTTIKTR